MAAGSDPELLVLHGLRLGGVADHASVARRWGLAPERVQALLDDVAARGWVTHRQGALSGWTLTAAGRREGERRLAEELDRVGARSLVEDRYRRFRVLNPWFLELCSDWQLRVVDGERVVNDHADPDHDRRVVVRLAEVHAEIGGIVTPLAGRLERFGGYAGRFDRAHRQVLAGEREWFTQPLVDSYHTVWFELHEDLLATLGRRRTEERPGGDAADGAPDVGR